MKRRSFIEFIGKGTLAVPLLQLGLSGCSSDIEEGIVANNLDELVLTEGLDYEILVKWGDRIGGDMFFGYNNDYTAFIPQTNDEALLWVNHEYINTFWVSGYERNGVITRHLRQVEEEMRNVGGSILK
jgi:secreted PhoX family phosphatase